MRRKSFDQTHRMNSTSLTGPSIVDFLPNLPGFRTSKSLTQTGAKKQCFHFVNGQIFMKDETLPPVGGLGGSVDLTDRSVLSIGTTSNILTRPLSRAEKQQSAQVVNTVLTFQAYFVEQMESDPDSYDPASSSLAESRVRKCNIYFYVDSGCMMIVEKPSLNSGIPQGKLVKKSVVFKQDGTPFTVHDLHLGEEIVVYNRRYKLIDCDNATRKYLKKMTGVTQCAPLDAPEDPYMASRKLVERTHSDEWGKYHSKKNPNKTWMEVMKGNYVDNTGREGFMRYGNQKLSFKCAWDNTGMLYGDRQEFSLVYHLCDDNVEIFGIPGPNSGKDQFSRLLKKSKLPKVMAPMTLEPVELKPQYYHWTDFYIGLEMDVYARKLRIVDCDHKTRQFYAQFDIDLGPPEYAPEPEVVVYEREIPPHNGIGSEEDTLRSCNGPLMPGPIPAKKLGENKMLSFFASLLSGGIDDINRRFVITYYCQDGTLKIQEPPIRNSGFNGGVFLSRRAIKAEDGEPLGVNHLYIGAKVRILKHRFLLLDSNESTLRWMEDKRLPRASFYDIIDKIRSVAYDDAVSGALASRFAAVESEPGRITKEAFAEALKYYGIIGDNPNDISEHELLTILRGNGNKLPTFNYVKVIEQIIRPTDEFK